MTEAKTGDTVRINYVGKLPDGNQFDSSEGREPLEFQIGSGQIIGGLDRGVQGMKVGGERTLIIPADMAYGAQGAGGMIPPNAPLIFDVSLKGVQK